MRIGPSGQECVLGGRNALSDEALAQDLFVLPVKTVILAGRTCGWLVVAGLMSSLGPMFLARVAAAFLADADFSCAGLAAKSVKTLTISTP